MLNADGHFVILGMNEAAVAGHGPVLNDNDAKGSGKVFKYLPGLRDAIKTSTIATNVQTSKRVDF